MTLIDKAEALAPCPFCGGGVSVTTTERVGGIVCDAPSECIGSGLLIVFDLEDMETALAAWNRRAIPARGVGVPSTTQPCTWPTCGCTAKGQFCEAPVRWFPQTASAAQAREAALREAAVECERHADWIEREQRKGVYSAEGCLRTSARNILAMIGKART